ncbi:MAG: GreA/GreB family elongation factor [Nanoarchaeota archaeon]|nr:GreA/GreB family elongation factor [DPANN group archaeon]MBL7116488.1 GreA/GreB family elongation factor [Nanoarchaeota archaeon]
MPTYFTKQGLDNYKEYLEGLENRLKELQLQVGVVTEGTNTWHDNAGYDHLVMDIRVADIRLNEAMAPIRNIELVTYPSSVDHVMIGSEVAFSIDGQVNTYEIVGYGEDDFDKFRILYNAPIIQKLMGHKKGDKYEAEFMGEKQEIEVLDVKPLSWVVNQQE